MRKQITTLMSLMLVTFLVACSGCEFSKQKTQQVQHKIYGVAVSPYVAKVRMYMDANKTPYELEEVLPLSLLRALGKEEHQKLKEVSPLGQIPAYENSKVGIADSTVILQYLEDLSAKGGRLSAEERAEVNFIEKYADTKLSSSTHTLLVQKLVKPLVLKAETDAQIVKESVQKLHPMLLFLEKKLEGKTYFVSERLTKADFAVMAHLGSLMRLEMIKETVGNGQYPTLSSYFNRLIKEDFFKVSHELS